MCIVVFSASDTTASTSTEPPSNIVTSWGNGRTTAAPGQAHKAVPAQPRRYRRHHWSSCFRNDNKKETHLLTMFDFYFYSAECQNGLCP